MPGISKDYVLYGPSISLFTRKLEAALRFYDVPFRREMVDAKVSERAGTHQVPVLRTPEDWVVADTTPILAMMDGRRPHRRLFPTGPAGVLVHIVEEVLDEWFARTMVHYRWHYEENAVAAIRELLGRPVTREEALEFPLAKWGPRSCRATGTESEHQQRAAEREYLALLDALEQQLAHSGWALGERPTAADTILLGGLRAHTNNDPVPDLSAYTRVLAWDADGAERWTGGGATALPWEANDFAEHVLGVAREQYAPFVLANREALAAGRKSFVLETYGEEVSYLARPYPERSRRYVVDRIRNQLDESERARVQDWLEASGLADCFRPEEE